MNGNSVRELLEFTTYRAVDVEQFLDPSKPSWSRFDPETGYAPNGVTMPDGIEDSRSRYTYTAAGHRKLVNYADRPCRINTYGDSFAQCQQVSDGETWQEYLAAHLGEPIRNFGVGGYGVHQAYRRARRMEAGACGAERVVLMVYDDDHVRNIDAARWIRSYVQNPAPPGAPPRMLHGIPWAHVRWDVRAGRFVERASLCPAQQRLRELSNPAEFHRTFKDDEVVHLFALERGADVGEVRHLEQLAEGLGVKVNLRSPSTRAADAQRLRGAYGLRSSEFVLDQMREWCAAEGKHLMVLLSYGRARIREAAEGKDRFDQSFVDYLESRQQPYVDGLAKHLEHFRRFNLSITDYLLQYFIEASVAAVCGHHNPSANHLYAFFIRRELVVWLDPKPPAYLR